MTDPHYAADSLSAAIRRAITVDEDFECRGQDALVSDMSPWVNVVLSAHEAQELAEVIDSTLKPVGQIPGQQRLF
jgi:hypothetical protein